ncbi:hypothetical protein OPS25_10595 [Alteromonas ponticola]|uniref:Uncharacterized protein n=1 Tax=Alteromonas aquimaris TaxID=2998417 RepID=A0ABT3P843_9ALTE|nr:hypothetical protein [Alteromonas aquimaris]MCW8108941.1 hypothetical protein [Alteromonas aquimaris]
MSFERLQTHQHLVAGSDLDVSYDRFTTKFELKVDGSAVYSKYLLFWPKHNAVIQIHSKPYSLNVYWFLLWGAKLKNAHTVIIKELLPKRRRRSIVILGYGVCMLLTKVAVVVFTP